MANYGGLGGGASFRDALMTPTITAPPMAAPPATGAPQPGGPVPLPRPRPNVVGLPGGPQPFPMTYPAAQQMYQNNQQVAPSLSNMDRAQLLQFLSQPR